MKLCFFFALCSTALVSDAVTAAFNRRRQGGAFSSDGLSELLAQLRRESGSPLDDYVNAVDSNYGYEQLEVYDEDESTIYVLNMTSQRWLPDGICDRPVWWHYLCIVVPHQLRVLDSAILYIDMYSNTDAIPTPTEKSLVLVTNVAKKTGAIVVDLKNVPNMPIVFYDDPTRKPRTENAILTWTFKTFLKHPSDPTILALLPMTKAVVRAMDAVQEFTKAILPHTNVESFLLSGGSKRGWTTWLTAVVDRRVKAIAPIVYDALNFVASMHHHFRAYGGWSFAVADFYDENITLHLDDPNTAKLMSIIDPYAYLDRLTLPKMVISTSGDEVFLGDDSHFWFEDIRGETHLRIVPNTEHMAMYHEEDIAMSIAAFFVSVLQNHPRPRFTWQLLKTATGGRIVVNTEDTPTAITVYHAKTISTTRRDFRLAIKSPNSRDPSIQLVLWSSDEVEYLGDGVYVAEYDKPATGWLAFFIELQFPAPEDSTMVFTTEMMIIPDTLPYPDCHGAGCAGSLVKRNSEPQQ